MPSKDKLTVIYHSHTSTFTYEPGESVLRILQKHGIPLRASCGGRGSCGDCMVLADGVWQKACRILASDFRQIEIPSEPCLANIELLRHDGSPLCHDETPLPHDEAPLCHDGTPMHHDGSPLPHHGATAMPDGPSAPDYGIAIDLGTTTIALALVRLSDGAAIASRGCPNPGSSYGADVLARIDAANHGHLAEMQQGLLVALHREIHRLLGEASVESAQLKEICIAANTTMCHLLYGLSCETLGRAPFRPATLSYPVLSAANFFSHLPSNPQNEPLTGQTADCEGAQVAALPGLSAFIGGDIVSGLYSLHPREECERYLFIDLGTNGEMVLSAGERLFCASVAAGPAFEGSRIPGSDVLAAVCEMQKKKALDRTGLFQGLFHYVGYRYHGHLFSQEDIRSIQLAKASVRAGIEALLHAASLPADDIDSVYLCGGFGSQTNPAHAIAIGMFPEEFRGKLHALGNTSLSGAVRCLTDPNPAFFLSLPKKLCLLDLASSETYQNAYVRWLDFP